jgi:hypothetical protein
MQKLRENLLQYGGDQYAIIIHDNEDYIPHMEWIPQPITGLIYSNPYVLFHDVIERLYAYDMIGRDLFLLGNTLEEGFEKWKNLDYTDWILLDPQNGEQLGYICDIVQQK